MRPHFLRSTWLKLLALAVGVVSFVLLYEARIFDSLTTGQTEPSVEFPSPGSTLLFSATAYCKGTTTASGVRVRSGIAAADPALLPIGSVVSIAAGDPEYDGVYSVLDTGPKIKGRRLDLYIWSCYEALRFGQQNVDVTVLRLGWDPDASSPDLVDAQFKRREAVRPVARPSAVPEAIEAPEDPADEDTDPAPRSPLEPAAGDTPAP